VQVEQSAASNNCASVVIKVTPPKGDHVKDVHLIVAHGPLGGKPTDGDSDGSHYSTPSNTATGISFQYNFGTAEDSNGVRPGTPIDYSAGWSSSSALPEEKTTTFRINYCPGAGKKPDLKKVRNVILTSTGERYISATDSMSKKKYMGLMPVLSPNGGKL
jgi:hypothetical protein